MAAGPSIKKDGVWQQRVFVTITRKEAPDGTDDGTDVDFHAKLTDLTPPNGGEKGMESQALMNGGRARIYQAEEDQEISGTLHAEGADSETRATLQSWKMGSSNDASGTSGHYQYETSLKRGDFRLVIMWTTDSTVTSATGAVSKDHDAFRQIAVDCDITQFDYDFSDGVLTADFTMMVPPFDPSGNSRYVEQEIDSGDASIAEGLAALATYDSSFDITTISTT